MSFFPAMIDMSKKSVLLVGGGNVACEKLSRLIDFTTDIRIVAPKVNSQTKKIAQDFGLKIYQREFEPKDLQNIGIVVVAVDNIDLQKEIYLLCKKSGILCNSVDSVEYCDFIFPSYIKRGDLVIAFSTSGASPSLAKYLRRAVEKMLPKELESFVKELKELRLSLPKGKQRQKILDSKAKDFIEKSFKGRYDVQ